MYSNYQKLPHYLKKWYVLSYILPLILLLFINGWTEWLTFPKAVGILFILYGISCFFATKASYGKKMVCFRWYHFWDCVDRSFYHFQLIDRKDGFFMQEQLGESLAYMLSILVLCWKLLCSFKDYYFLTIAISVK